MFDPNIGMMMLKRNAELEEALRDMVGQFCYQGICSGVDCYYTGGLSALEEAFEVLGWDDPMPKERVFNK